MRSIPAQLEKLACRVLVPALLLWFSSASLLSCCARDALASAYRPQTAQSSASVIEDSEAAHCADMQEHCSKAEQKAPVLSIVNLCNAHRQSSGPMPCCSPASQSADRARKSRIAPEARAETIDIQDRWGSPQAIARPRPNAFTIPVRDRSGTYLRDCLFLI
jgi:hypothetical protein